MTDSMIREHAPLRIVMVAACPFPETRGTPVRIFRMAEALALHGHEVHVVTYHFGTERAGAPFRIHRIPNRHGYRRTAPGPTFTKLALLDPLLARELRRVVRQVEPHVVHAHHYEGLLVARSLGRRLGAPLIYDAHTLLGSELPYYFGRALRGAAHGIGDWFDRHVPSLATHVISVTPTLRDRLVALGAVHPERITTITNGVEHGHFEGPRLAANGAPRTIVFAGNLAGYQGIDHLLRAFAAVRTRRADVRLRLVTGSSLDGYGVLIDGLGIGDAIDIVEDRFDRLPGYLRSAHVAVNPRVDCDGIPQKLMNYMAAACPIVSFNGSAAHLRHDETGWLVPDRDVGAMAEGIVRLLDDDALASRLGTAARQDVLAKYSWERVGEQTESVYRRVLESWVEPVRVAAPAVPSPVPDLAAHRPAAYHR